MIVFARVVQMYGKRWNTIKTQLHVRSHLGEQDSVCFHRPKYIDSLCDTYRRMLHRVECRMFRTEGFGIRATDTISKGCSRDPPQNALIRVVVQGLCLLRYGSLNFVHVYGFHLRLRYMPKPKDVDACEV